MWLAYLGEFVKTIRSERWGKQVLEDILPPCEALVGDQGGGDTADASGRCRAPHGEI